VVGYGISHPWKLFSIPPLDEFLGAIPEDADCIYIHDVAVLPDARGHQAAAHYLKLIRNIAAGLSIAKLACVSVYGTDVLWSRYGFKAAICESMTSKLRTYGDSAKYMIADV
jgi:N-acetylglutamate synthase-like GNAT family acetyltransferase